MAFYERDNEVIVLAEDLVRSALEVAECYPINKRFAGFIDYKRVRWLPSPLGIFPQVLLVDAKASTENTRTTLQRSQLPMDAEFLHTLSNTVVSLTAGVPPHLLITMQGGLDLPAITTSAFIHFHYSLNNNPEPPYRTLNAIYLMALPHQRLKPRYNPRPAQSFFGEGKHSSARQEAQRIRVYFDRLRQMCPWRLQTLTYPPEPNSYTNPLWRDVEPNGTQKDVQFAFIGR